MLLPQPNTAMFLSFVWRLSLKKKKKTSHRKHHLDTCFQRTQPEILPNYLHWSFLINIRNTEGDVDIPDGISGKEPACQHRRHNRCGFDPWFGKIPWTKSGNSSILAWRIPWTEESGELQSIESQRVGHNWSDFTHTHTHTHRKGTWWAIIHSFKYIMLERTVDKLGEDSCV